MCARVAALIALGILLVGCSAEAERPLRTAFGASPVPPTGRATAAAVQGARSLVASWPDRGSFVAYDNEVPVVRRGASIWRPVRISEARALRAIAEGGMTIERASGAPIRVKYERHIEHPNGNWTWIGRASDASGGSTVLTFGERAVFGTIAGADGEPLELTTSGGRVWAIETNPAMLTKAQREDPKGSDYVVAPAMAITPRYAASKPIRSTASRTEVVRASPASQTVDLVLGYTTGFAARLGGTSQAVTRLNYLVDLANQAYADSQVEGRVRLVQTVQVDYSDTTSNQTALFELTGVTCTTSNAGSVRLPDRGLNCSPATTPAALQPLLDARENFGADLVSLVRVFNSPEHGSCGVAWLLGAGQTAINSSSADFAFSVVSDTNGSQFPDEGTVCREEYLAHEMGHNMGLQHDRETAQGADDTNSDGNLLDPEEYGSQPYTFGHVAGADAGNFYTVMSLRRAGATGYRVFSNPRITSCGGNPCGIADQADNARGLGITMPIVAGFRAFVVPFGIPDRDYNGDGQSDILWRNGSDGRNVVWRSANSSSSQAVTPVADLAWKIVGSGDFDGDGVSDILWRNSSNGRNAIWRSANSATPQAVSTVAAQSWQVAGVGDFDGDGRSDILWRNTSDGKNAIWKSGNSATVQAVATVPGTAWKIVGVGDFNADGRSDILWRNSVTGQNAIWRSGNSATPQAVSTVTVQAWQVAGVGDFDGDGRSDILWRNAADGRNTIWKSGGSATVQAVSTVGDVAWKVVGTGDYNGDGQSDILWRHGSNGRNAIWRSANSAAPQAVTTVSVLSWTVAG